MNEMSVATIEYVPLKSEDLPAWPDSQPTPVAVQHLGGYKLWVKFTDGAEGALDLTLTMTRLEGPIIRALRKPELFRRVRIDHDQETLAWPRIDPNDPTTAYDIAPDYLYRRCVYGDGHPFADDCDADLLFTGRLKATKRRPSTRRILRQPQRSA